MVIDSCTACDLVWLDFGELAQIVDAPGRDRGRRGVEAPTASDHRGPTAASTTSTGDREAGELFALLLDLF